MVWHPIQLAYRTGPDELTMVDPHYGNFGVIRRLQFGGETWYRGVTWADGTSGRELIGYSRDCRAIAMAVYARHMHDSDTMKGPPATGPAIEYGSSPRPPRTTRRRR